MKKFYFFKVRWLLLFWVIIIGYGANAATPLRVQVLGVQTPSDANGVYVKQSGTYGAAGLEFWKHETKEYYLYCDLYNSSYLWNLDNDKNNINDVLFEASYPNSTDLSYVQTTFPSPHIVGALGNSLFAPISGTGIGGFVNAVGTPMPIKVVEYVAGTAPTVTTQAVSSIATTTATGNGNITSLGSPNPTAHGVCWNTTGTPTVSDSKVDKGAASATGPFAASMTSLIGNTTYYVRAYATNSSGTSYGAQESFTTLPIAPTVTTEAVSSIATTTATGNGTITSLGVPNPTAYGICWNTSSNPTTANSKVDKGAASATGAFTASMTSLTANASYYVRAYATNSAGTVYGAEVSFTTLGITPTVTTEAVSSIATTTATGNGTITSLGVPNPTAYGICWNTSSNPTTANSKVDKGAASATGAFTASMTSLTANTTYYVRAFATNSAGAVYGAEVSFTTLPLAPTVTTEAVSSIATTTATGNGTITSLGAPNPTAYGICWNTSSNPTTANSKVDKGAASATGAFTASMTSLTANTTYYVRAFATNSAGAVYGAEVSFTTLPLAPTVTTEAVSSIASTTATGNGTITSLGVPNPTAYGICWNTSSNPTTANSKVDKGAASATGAFTASMTSLTANTSYYVRAYVTNTVGTSYGSEVTFTTSPLAPVVTTQAVSSIAATTATGNGNITDLGVPNPIQYGVVWSTSTNPTVVLTTKTAQGAIAITGAFTSSITGLAANTTYYVKAYATNTAGTSYGIEVTFTTITTGIEDSKEMNFKVYPNPAVEKINISIENLTTGSYTIEIFNLIGRKVYQRDVNDPSENQTIDLNGFAEGIYFVKAYNKKFSYSRKFIVR